MQAWGVADIDAWLAAVLMEHQPAWPFGDAAADVLAVADAEGVAALVQARLQAAALAAPAEFRAALDALVRGKAAQSLYQRAQCRAIVEQLAAAGIPALVLKGMALAQWAYPEPYLRECGDIDLLLPSRDDVGRAVELLIPMGYAPPTVLMPGDMVRFETACVGGSEKGRLEIDLHWRLSNAPALAFRFGWDELWETAVMLPTLAPNARGLVPSIALVHACMHRAKHFAEREARMKWVYDLVVVARRFGDDDWHAVCHAAIAHGLAGACSFALEEAEATFGTFVPADVLRALRDAASREVLQVARLRNKWYFQRMNWKAFPTTRMRWRWLWQQLVPDADYLRRRYATRSVGVALWRRACGAARWLFG